MCGRRVPERRGEESEDAHRARRSRIAQRRRRCDACVDGVAVLLVLLTLFGSFFPFEGNPPLSLTNGARREGSAIRFADPGLVEVSLGDRFATPLARGARFDGPIPAFRLAIPGLLH